MSNHEPSYYHDFFEECLGIVAFAIGNRIVARVEKRERDYILSLHLKREELTRITDFADVRVDEMDIEFHDGIVSFSEGGFSSLIVAKCAAIRFLIRAKILDGNETDYIVPNRFIQKEIHHASAGRES